MLCFSKKYIIGGVVTEVLWYMRRKASFSCRFLADHHGVGGQQKHLKDRRGREHKLFHFMYMVEELLQKENYF